MALHKRGKTGLQMRSFSHIGPVALQPAHDEAQSKGSPVTLYLNVQSSSAYIEFKSVPGKNLYHN